MTFKIPKPEGRNPKEIRSLNKMQTERTGAQALVHQLLHGPVSGFINLSQRHAGMLGHFPARLKFRRRLDGSPVQFSKFHADFSVGCLNGGELTSEFAAFSQ